MAKVITLDVEARSVTVEYPWGAQETLTGLSYGTLFGQDAEYWLKRYILDVQETRRISLDLPLDGETPLDPEDVEGETFEEGDLGDPPSPPPP